MKAGLSIFVMMLLNAYYGICQTGKIISNELYTPTTSEKAKSYYNTGHDAMEDHNFKNAIAYFRLAVLEDPRYVDAYDNMGVSYRQLNMLDSAEYCYRTSIKLYPKGTIARRNLAVVEEKRGNLEKALACYKDALAIDDKNPETYYGMMRVYLGMKKFTDALECGNKTEKYYLEQNDPNIGDCYLMLCITHLMMNNKEKAKSYAELAQKKGLKLNNAIVDALK